MSQQGMLTVRPPYPVVLPLVRHLPATITPSLFLCLRRQQAMLGFCGVLLLSLFPLLVRYARAVMTCMESEPQRSLQHQLVVQKVRQ